MQMDWKTLGLGVTAGVVATGAVAAILKLFRRSGVSRGGGLWRLGKSHYTKDALSLYVNSHNCEDEVLARLRAASTRHSLGMMTTGAEVGRLLVTLTRTLAAKKAIDVGVFTGCSAFAIALSLPDSGKVIACDVSSEYADIGRPYWVEGGVAEKIDLRLRPAAETLQALLDNGEGGTFDLVFIDADKQNYLTYYELGLELLRQGGLVVVDNALWGGKVADANVRDEYTQSIREVNTRMKSDPRVDYVLLAVSDGIGIACKR